MSTWLTSPNEQWTLMFDSKALFFCEESRQICGASFFRGHFSHSIINHFY
jgi:hypothetical protein